MVEPGLCNELLCSGKKGIQQLIILGYKILLIPGKLICFHQFPGFHDDIGKIPLFFRYFWSGKTAFTYRKKRLTHTCTPYCWNVKTDVQTSDNYDQCIAYLTGVK